MFLKKKSFFCVAYQYTSPKSYIFIRIQRINNVAQKNKALLRFVNLFHSTFQSKSAANSYGSLAKIKKKHTINMMISQR